MSTTYSLYCKDTKQSLWIGQGHPNMETFYSGEPSVMEKLGRFLTATIGKTLVLLSDHELEGVDCSEFEGPTP